MDIAQRNPPTIVESDPLNTSPSISGQMFCLLQLRMPTFLRQIGYESFAFVPLHGLQERKLCCMSAGPEKVRPSKREYRGHGKINGGPWQWSLEGP